jgi:hypothetical protein
MEDHSTGQNPHMLRFFRALDHHGAAMELTCSTCRICAADSCGVSTMALVATRTGQVEGRATLGDTPETTWDQSKRTRQAAILTLRNPNQQQVHIITIRERLAAITEVLVSPDMTKA